MDTRLNVISVIGKDMSMKWRCIHISYKYREHKFYHTTDWKRKRLEILDRDNYECQMCKERGQQSQATTVHHMVHLRTDKSLALTDSNLLSLCSACHNEVHPEKLKKFETDIHEERWE